MPSERRRTGAGPGRPLTWRARRGRDVRAKSDPRRAVASVDGQALRDLVAGTVAGDARLVRVPVNQPPWTPTGLAVTAGEDVSWLAWASPRLLRPLGPALCSRLVLRGRAGDGVPVQGTRDTVTFRADRTGQLRLGSAYPGELQADRDDHDRPHPLPGDVGDAVGPPRAMGTRQRPAVRAGIDRRPRPVPGWRRRHHRWPGDPRGIVPAAASFPVRHPGLPTASDCAPHGPSQRHARPASAGQRVRPSPSATGSDGSSWPWMDLPAICRNRPTGYVPKR